MDVTVVPLGVEDRDGVLVCVLVGLGVPLRVRVDGPVAVTVAVADIPLVVGVGDPVLVGEPVDVPVDERVREGVPVIDAVALAVDPLAVDECDGVLECVAVAVVDWTCVTMWLELGVPV